MKKYSTLFLAASVTFALGGCASTTDNTSTTATASPVPSVQQAVTPEVEMPTAVQNGKITLKQVMADPQWMGALPTDMGWSVDGSKIVFEREKQDSALSDVYIADINTLSSKAKAMTPSFRTTRSSKRYLCKSDKGAFTASLGVL
ncbi:MAG: hypothetical protein AAF364_19375, partial [Pseudomonadota bacterium]